VALDGGVLLLGEPPGLQEDRIGQGDLPEIVEVRAPGDRPALIVVKAERLGERPALGDDTVGGPLGLQAAKLALGALDTGMLSRFTGRRPRCGRVGWMSTRPRAP
jgi:hypothetical protein